MIISVRKRWIIISTNDLYRTCYLKINNVESFEQISPLKFHLLNHSNNSNNTNIHPQVQAREMIIMKVTENEDWTRSY